MTLVLSFIGIAILVGVVVTFARTPVPAPSRVTVAQIGSIFESLGAAPAQPAFAIVSFTTPERPRASDALDLQFFKENGRVGFDWPLSTPRNLEDEERFLSFAHAMGFVPRPMETNGIRHLRVDEGDVLRLCLRVITELYGQPQDARIELIVEGFEEKIIAAALQAK
ncbi:MAG: hypothetical protein WDO68_03280 [Gammaproteobacteria bacterium]